jgi:hypothetical protein
MYTAGTFVGCALLGVSPTRVNEVDWSLSGPALYASALESFRPLLWPFLLGNLVLGLGAAAIAFFAIRAVLLSRRSTTAEPDG